MWKFFKLSKLWSFLSITYQSRKLCLLENISGKSTELDSGLWITLRAGFLKKYPFSTSFSPWGRRNPDFAVCFVIQTRSTVYIYAQYFTMHNSEFFLKEDRNWQQMNWAPRLFEINENITVTTFFITIIGKQKSSFYIMQKALQVCFLLFCHSLGREPGKQMQTEKKEA